MLAWCRHLLIVSLWLAGSLAGWAQSAVGVVPSAAWPGYVRSFYPKATASRTRLVTAVYPEVNDPLPNYPASIQVFDISARIPSRPDSVVSISNNYVGKPVLFGDSQWCAILSSDLVNATTTRVRIFDVRRASESKEVTQLSFPGGPAALTAEGTLLVVTHAQTLQSTSISLIDAGNPLAPVRLATIHSTNRIQGARIIGNRLLTWGAALEVYDLTVPAKPVFLGQYLHPGTTYDVTALGQYAYVALGNEFRPSPGIQVLDLSNPAAPANVAILSDRVGGCLAVRAVGESLLSVDLFGFVTRWSLAVPAKPRELESTLLANLDVGSYDLTGTAASGADHNGRAQVATWGPDGSGITNFAGIRLETGGVSLRLAAAGTRVFLSDSGLSPVRLFDVAASGVATEFIGHDAQGLFTGVADGFDVDSSGARLVLEQPEGLVLFDVSTPAVPRRLALVEGTVQPGGFRILGNRLVAARGDKLTIHDLSVPATPVLVGSVTRLPGSYATMDVDGTLAAIADATVQFGSSVGFYDLSNAATPREVSRMTFADSSGGVKLGGGFAYLAARTDGLRIYDVRVPAKPVQAAHVEFADPNRVAAEGLALQGEYLFVAARLGGLLVYNVSDPYHPRLVGRHPVDGSAVDVALGDRGVCVAAREYGVQVFAWFPVAAKPPARLEGGGTFQYVTTLPRAGLEGSGAVVKGEAASSPTAVSWEPPAPGSFQADASGWGFLSTGAESSRFFRFRIEFP